MAEVMTAAWRRRREWRPDDDNENNGNGGVDDGDDGGNDGGNDDGDGWGDGDDGAEGNNAAMALTTTMIAMTAGMVALV